MGKIVISILMIILITNLTSAYGMFDEGWLRIKDTPRYDGSYSMSLTQEQYGRMRSEPNYKLPYGIECYWGSGQRCIRGYGCFEDFLYRGYAGRNSYGEEGCYT